MPRLRMVVRWSVRVLAVLVLLLVLVLLFLFRGALYNRMIRFPREAKAWEAIRAARTPVDLETAWTDYRGFCHSHSEWSHDCDVPFEAILQMMKETDRDFACMSDHCVDGKADYGLQWRGVKDGKLFVCGFEMDYGFMPWGLGPEVVLDCGAEEGELARQITEQGGLLFFAHTEQKRTWDLPQLTGMEIYNIHTDFMDEGFAKLGPDLLLNLRAYPDQTFRLLFDRQTAILENWDRLNRDRKIVGIAANDCHQNNGVRGRITEEGELLLIGGDGDPMDTYDLNLLTRALLRIAFGPLERGEELFRLQLDPYERMVRFVATHVLAKELTEEAILGGLREGRAFIGFDMIADSRGFLFVAEGDGRQAVMGEAIPHSAGMMLRAASPHACRFTVVRDGGTVHQEEGSAMAWAPDGTGKYRLEAELDVCGAWVPWVYTNPIEVTPG